MYITNYQSIKGCTLEGDVNVEYFGKQLTVEAYVNAAGLVAMSDPNFRFSNETLFVIERHEDGYGIPRLLKLNQPMAITGKKDIALAEMEEAFK